MYRCSKCQALHANDLVDAWGSHPGTVNAGPEAVCISLVKIRGAQPYIPPTGGEPEFPSARCGGRLLYEASQQAPTPTPTV